MKKHTSSVWAALTLAAVVMSGCDSSKEPAAPEPSPAPEPPAAAQPTAAKEPAAAAPTASTQVKELASETVQTAKDSLAAATAQLSESLQSSSDPKLKELSSDLTEKIKSLSSTLTADAPLKEKLQSAVASLSSGNDGESLGALQQIKEANLTPEQGQLVKEVQNVWSAVVVEKNFASLTSAETEVGKIVNALQAGDSATALTNLKELSSKATLTTQQKDLLNSLVAQYAPGLAGTGDALKEGVKNLNPFGK